MTGVRFIVRVFDGKRWVHLGPYRDENTADQKARAIALAARRRGMNVSAGVHTLLAGSTSRVDALNALAFPRSTAASYSGRPEQIS